MNRRQNDGCAPILAKFAALVAFGWSGATADIFVLSALCWFLAGSFVLAVIVDTATV
jgi:hypothetical protein